MKYWILAARPKTLVAGIIPVFLGSALAAHVGGFQAGVLWAALLGALAIQIGTNYINDASDFERGADTEERLGPARMAASGHLSPRALYRSSVLCFLFAFLAGSYLVLQAGPAILLIGLFSIFFAIIYTAGPFPLAYLGLGDIFVLIFFGIIAVMGTYFSHVREISWPAFFLSLATGFHGVALIAVNNLRDIPTDIKVGKRTLCVRMGDAVSRRYYAALLFLPYLCWLPVAYKMPIWWILLPALSLPLAFKNRKTVFQIQERRKFNGLLAKTAALQLLFGLLASFSLVMSAA
jgi:1,4-dihydroxy-2-naphthoate octaprenyltransferase